MTNATVDQAIARAIRMEVASQGRSERWLAQRLGMVRSALSLRLAGERPFRASEVVGAAAALGVSLDRLLVDARKTWKAEDIPSQHVHVQAYSPVVPGGQSPQFTPHTGDHHG